jgi:hypothetical protein
VLFFAVLHPMAVPVKAANASRQSSVLPLRRRRGRPKKSIAAIAALPPTTKIRCSAFWSAEADVAVVLMVTDADTAAVPEIAAGVAAVHVGMSTAPAGPPLTAHTSATLPVKPPLGVIVMVEVPLAPGDGMLTAVLLNVKVGVGGVGTAMLTGTNVASGVLTSKIPVTVTVYAPTLLAVWVLTVSAVVTAAVPEIDTDVGIVQVGASTTTDGPPATSHISVTSPKRPLIGVTVMVEVPLVPGAMLTAVPVTVKFGETAERVTVTGTTIEFPLDAVTVT